MQSTAPPRTPPSPPPMRSVARASRDRRRTRAVCSLRSRHAEVLSPPSPPGSARVVTSPDVAAAERYEVRIIRDEYGVPHIYGMRDADTAFGLAYAHAEDDFATIQEVLLATRGQLAAVRGPGAAETDYLIRLMRIWEAVDDGYDTELSEHAREIAHANSRVCCMDFQATTGEDRISSSGWTGRGS